jgi:hypothetical protein
MPILLNVIPHAVRHGATPTGPCDRTGNSALVPIDVELSVVAEGNPMQARQSAWSSGRPSPSVSGEMMVAKAINLGRIDLQS